MGRLERKLSGEEFWEKLRKTGPIIQQRADQTMHSLGYDPSRWTSSASPTGQDEAIWVVKYWYAPPKDYYRAVANNGDLEVHLNRRGEIKRVLKYSNGKEELIYGKDERIQNGMTPEQVRERLGAPDHIGPPPRRERDVGNEEWRYDEKGNRTMRIEILFKDRRVFFVGYFG